MFVFGKFRRGFAEIIFPAVNQIQTFDGGQRVIVRL